MKYLPQLNRRACMNPRLLFRLAVAGVSLFAGASVLSAQQVAFGGIELASSSVKGLTFVFQPGAEAGSRGWRQGRPHEASAVCGAQRQVHQHGGWLQAERARNGSAGERHRGCRQELREGAKAQNLGTLQLFVVGSSGLGAVCNTDEIIAKVQAGDRALHGVHQRVG